MQTLHRTTLSAVQYLVDRLAAHIVDDPSQWSVLRLGHTRTGLVAAAPRDLPDSPTAGVCELDTDGARWRPHQDAPVAAWLHLRTIDGTPKIVGHAVDERGRTVTVPVTFPPGLAEWAATIPEHNA